MGLRRTQLLLRWGKYGCRRLGRVKFNNYIRQLRGVEKAAGDVSLEFRREL